MGKELQTRNSTDDGLALFAAAGGLLLQFFESDTRRQQNNYDYSLKAQIAEYEYEDKKENRYHEQRMAQLASENRLNEQAHLERMKDKEHDHIERMKLLAIKAEQMKAFINAQEKITIKKLEMLNDYKNTFTQFYFSLLDKTQTQKELLEQEKRRLRMLENPPDVQLADCTKQIFEKENTIKEITHKQKEIMESYNKQLSIINSDFIQSKKGISNKNIKYIN
ncbi:MAG: hypothetical protein ACRC5H_00745 [Treponemataceae bacterium]